MMTFASLSLFLVLTTQIVTANLDWSFDQFKLPDGHVGEHTGVKVYDVNHDGYPDLLFSAGRHSIDQSYVLLNLGPASANETTNTTTFGGFRWSRELPIGIPGGYYQVDVAPLSTIEQGHVGVLLAGGVCTRRQYCEPGTLTPAVLLDVKFGGCSAKDKNPDPMSCQVEWDVIWTETPATGNRNGALSTFLGEPGKPAIVLVGGGKLTVTHWYDPISGYPTTPDYELLAEDKILDEDDDINRSSGLAVGYVGTRKAIVLGPRSTGFRAPAPVVVVYQESDGTGYSHYHVEEDNNVNTTVPGYAGNPDVDVQPTGITLADINGDGTSDIIPANFFNFRLIEEGYPIVQPVYLVDEDPQDDTPLFETMVFEAFLPARVVTSASLFDQSELPDLIYGMANGDIALLANQGVDSETGEFAGFEFSEVLNEVSERSCIIRDIEVTSLGPCSISIIAATICYNPEHTGNVIFTAPMAHLKSCTDQDDGHKLGGGGGDPHIKRWDMQRFSFHGECDLVLVHNLAFHGNNGIDIHVRSTIESYFSFFESVAVKIANTTTEFYRNQYLINGEIHALDDLPFEFQVGEHMYSIAQANVSGTSQKSSHTTYLFQLHDKSEIKIRFYKKFANVDIVGHPEDFEHSVGLLGDFSTGEAVGRSGQVMNNYDDFGFEWQVTPGVDPALFHQARAPQLPYERCRMPTMGRPSRRLLRGNAALLGLAETACAHVGNPNDFDLCLGDVLATGDLGLADLW